MQGFETFGYVGLGRAQYVRLLPFEQYGFCYLLMLYRPLNNKHPLSRYIIHFTIGLKNSLRVKTFLHIPHRHTCGLRSEEFSDQTVEASSKWPSGCCTNSIFSKKQLQNCETREGFFFSKVENMWFWGASHAKEFKNLLNIQSNWVWAVQCDQLFPSGYQPTAELCLGCIDWFKKMISHFIAVSYTFRFLKTSGQ